MAVSKISVNRDSLTQLEVFSHSNGKVFHNGLDIHISANTPSGHIAVGSLGYESE